MNLLFVMQDKPIRLQKAVGLAFMFKGKNVWKKNRKDYQNYFDCRCVYACFKWNIACECCDDT